MSTVLIWLLFHRGGLIFKLWPKGFIVPKKKKASKGCVPHSPWPKYALMGKYQWHIWVSCQLFPKSNKFLISQWKFPTLTQDIHHDDRVSTAQHLKPHFGLVFHPHCSHLQVMCIIWTPNWPTVYTIWVQACLCFCTKPVFVCFP